MPKDTKAPLDWSVQYNPPTPDRVGVLLSTENARRAAAGMLMLLANAWPDDQQLPGLIIDNDKQGYFAWIARQVASSPALTITVVSTTDATASATVDDVGVITLKLPSGAFPTGVIVNAAS